VADLDNRVIAVARVEEFEDFCFLNSVGTTTDQQGKGIAGKLLEGILVAYSKDVYLYTIIPNFFRKYGFEISDFYGGLPERETFDCGNCQPGKCVCMLHRTRSVVQEPERKSFKS
jgi:N-acetylglutamate synthase-like GNAT family acetyltransferase